MFVCDLHVLRIVINEMCFLGVNDVPTTTTISDIYSALALRIIDLVAGWRSVAHILAG